MRVEMAETEGFEPERFCLGKTASRIPRAGQASLAECKSIEGSISLARLYPYSGMAETEGFEPSIPFWSMLI